MATIKKGVCNICEVAFSTKTLNKYGGCCGNCFRVIKGITSAWNLNYGVDAVEPQPCKICQRSITKKTCFVQYMAGNKKQPFLVCSSCRKQSDTSSLEHKEQLEFILNKQVEQPIDINIAQQSTTMDSNAKQGDNGLVMVSKIKAIAEDILSESYPPGVKQTTGSLSVSESNSDSDTDSNSDTDTGADKDVDQDAIPQGTNVLVAKTPNTLEIPQHTKSKDMVLNITITKEMIQGDKSLTINITI